MNIRKATSWMMFGLAAALLFAVAGWFLSRGGEDATGYSFSSSATETERVAGWS